MRDDDDPLWKRIVTNENLWVALAILLILAAAFHLATRPSADPKPPAPAAR
jgi:hypothetical protein